MGGEIKLVIFVHSGTPHRLQVRYSDAGPKGGRTKLFVSSKVHDPCNFSCFRQVLSLKLVMVWVNSVAFRDECKSAIKRGPVLFMLDSRDHQLEGG